MLELCWSPTMFHMLLPAMQLEGQHIRCSLISVLNEQIQVIIYHLLAVAVAGVDVMTS